MLSLKAKIRKNFSKQTRVLRKKGIIPAVLYGAEIKNLFLEIDRKEFEDVYRQAGESSLISLEVEGKKFPVLIHQTARDPIKEEFLHIDFYHPSTKKKVEAEIPLVFEGEAPAVKELGGVLEKAIQIVEVKGLAQDLPREIKVDVSNLKTFEDRVLIEDLKIPEGIKILKDAKEIVVHVVPPKEEKIEEEIPEEKKVVEEKPEEEKAEEGGEKEEKTS